MMARKTQKPSNAEVPPAPARWWRQRWGVCAVGVLALLILLYFLAGPSWPILLDHLPRDSSLLTCWLLAAAGYGALVPLAGSAVRSVSSPTEEWSARRALLEKTDGGFHAITRLALGLGILGLLQLALGLAGFLHQFVAFALVALGIALFAIRLRPARIKEFFTAPADADWLWLLALLPLAMAIVAAYVPPGILWGDEPHGYDVLEYHLQIPREWYELHRIVPLHHNVFSYFPQGMEMHYLLAMQLRGGPWAGMYLAQLMHVAMIALTIAAIYATARQFAPKLTSILAATAAAYVPWMTLLAPVAYNEGALVLFATLAIGWAISLCRGDACVALPGEQTRATQTSPLPLQSAIIAGVLTGFACGVKLTAVPQLLILLPIVLAIVVRPPLRTLAITTAAFLLSATITFSPWLIRNTIWTRNPVFPEAQRLLGSAHFSPQQTERWTIANHLPGPQQRNAAGRIAAIGSQIFADWRYGYVLIPAGLLAVLLSLRHKPAQLLLALLLAWLIFWVAFTHLQGRFFTLAIPACALSLALMQKRWQLVVVAIVAVQIAAGGYLITQAYNQKVAPVAEGGLLAFDDFSKFLPEDVQTLLPKTDRPFALVGDAKAFLYQIPTSRLRYRTVFDVDVEPTQSILQAWLGEQTGSPLIVIDPTELERFSRTYLGIPPLPPEFPGPRDHAFVLTPSR